MYTTESGLDMGGVAARIITLFMFARVAIKRDPFMYRTQYDGMHGYPGIVSVWETSSEN